MPDERGSAGRTLRVLQISGDDLEPVQLAVDDQMLIVKQSYWTAAAAPPPQGRGRGPAPTRQVRSEEVFSDYRSVNGVRVPFEASVVRDGHTVLKRVVTQVVFNDPSVTPSLFERPANTAPERGGRGRGR
jgi:hypothetical protein